MTECLGGATVGIADVLSNLYTPSRECAIQESERMRRVAIISIAALFVATSTVGASGANAATNDLAPLMKLNPGVSKEALDAAIAAEMRATGATRAQVIAQGVAEGKASADEAAASARLGRVSSNSKVSPQSSGGGNRTLGSAAAVGDVFVSPASTLFIQHGHTGIYYAKSAIVEAPGGDLKSRSISANSTVVGQGTVKQHVDVSQSTRNSAAGYAYSNLRGKPYNSNFFMNRFEYGSTMNCSQLVWAAYLIKAGIDIDGNGGLGVYPYNIKDSRFTSTYATLN